MRIRKRMIAVACAVALLAGITAVEPVAAAKTSKLSLNKSICVMKKGTKVKLKAMISLDQKYKAVKWSSSNWKVASVNWKGVVQAKKKGKATIKVAVGSEKASCRVIVGIPVKKVKVSNKNITLPVGSIASIRAGVLPETASVSKLKYTSKNKEVATVSKNGRVRGVNVGTTRIVVRSTDGTNKSAWVKVVVKQKEEGSKTEPPINVIVNVTVNVPESSNRPGDYSTQKPDDPTDTQKPDDPMDTQKPGDPTDTQKPDDPTDTQKPGVEVTGISLSETEKALNINETLQLTAHITPADAADQGVKWKSSDTGVATVSDQGLVTPEKEGTAEITATTANGRFTATCTVTVSPTAVVSTNKEIVYALSKQHLKTLEVKSDTDKKLTVPAGTYDKVDMVIDLPNGELENNAVFHKIEIKRISENTFFENAVGNIIDILSKKSHIIIGEGADATLTISENSTEVSVENNGNIKKLNIKCEGKVNITGDSDKRIPVEIHADAAVSTTKVLDIDAKEHFDITIRPGAESTKITVDAEIHVPGIFGLGMISVKINATGEVKTVISENVGPDEMAEQVDFNGVVHDVNGDALEGVDIYMVGYCPNYDIQNIESDSDTIRLTTGADGKYSSENKVVTGNYYLLAKKDGYMPVSQQIIITSTYGDTYTNEEIILIPSDWEGKTGNVTGKILDSVQKDLAISGIDVLVRKGKGTFDDKDSAVVETQTNEQGIYLVNDLPAGYYTIKLSDTRTLPEGEENYLSTWINVLIRPGETTIEGAVMSKTLNEGQLRFILSWGSEDSGAAADLDAHLRGPGAYGDRFHTFFSNKSYNSEESHSDLDVDDMDYEGPETTTIYQRVPGVYSYYVHSYTNRYDADSSKLSESSVKVEVYDGNYKQNTYYIPKQAGNVWHVFDYDSNTKTFKTINTVYDERNEWNVGNTIEEYKQGISSDLESIQQYYKTLEAGTGEDIPEKTAAYQKRLEALTDTQESETVKLYYEVYDYREQLYYECYLSCYTEGVYTNNFDWVEGKLTVELNDEDCELTTDVINGWNEAQLTPVTPTESDAWKAFRVVAESGHTRIVHVYKNFNFDYIQLKKAVVGEENLSWGQDNFYSEDDGQYYPCLYMYSDQGTEFEPKDIAFTFSSKSVTVDCDSHKVGGEYTVTIRSEEKERTWVIRKRQLLQIDDGDNKIYKMVLSGASTLYVYADRKMFSDECTITLNGQKCEMYRQKSEPHYSQYSVNAPDGSSYYVYCYPIDYACSLTDVSFSPYVTVEMKQSEQSIIVTAGSPGVTPEELTLNWYNTNAPIGADTKYESVSGEDHIGVIKVTIDGVTDYEKIYKVYFKPYE